MRVVWDGKATNYDHVPQQSELKLDPRRRLCLHDRERNDPGGAVPKRARHDGVPLVCDASSDILCRPLPINRYGLIYACAQKNVGPAGVTMVIIRDDLVEKSPKDLPSILSYGVMAENKSLLNTPPVFAIYMVKLVTDWLLNQIGGLDKM